LITDVSGHPLRFTFKSQADHS